MARDETEGAAVAQPRRQPLVRMRGADLRRAERFWIGRRRRRSADDAVARQEPAPVDISTPERLENPSAPPASPLEQAARDLCESEAMVEQQKERVFELRRNGLATAEGERTLRALQDQFFEQRKVLAMLQNRHRRGL